MSEIIVARFPDHARALAAKADFLRLGETYRVEPEDIEIVTRTAHRTRIIPEVDLPRAQMVGGAIWGAVLGTAFLVPVLGAVIGTGVGYVTGRATDVGISQDVLRDIGQKLEPGQSAVALLARKAEQGAVDEVITRHRGEVLRSSLGGGQADQIETWHPDDPRAEKAEMRNQPTLA